MIMGGGDSYTTSAPPVDYSAAMAYQSDNNKTVAMGQIMASMFAVQQSSMDHETQIAATLEQGLESLDTKLQIAKLNYVQSMTEEEDRHTEAMTEIDAARTDDTTTTTTDTTDVSDFLADGSGGYTPGAIWNDATSYSDSNQVDIGAEWNQLLQNDQAAQASKDQMMTDHEESQQAANDDYYNSLPTGDSDGDGIPNESDIFS
jgi:hypothetical protein